MAGEESIPAEYADLAEGLEKQGLAIESVLGRGGVGVVFAARQDDAKVAVKIAHPHVAESEAWSATSTVQRLRVPKLTADGLAVHCIPAVSLSLCNRVVQGETVRLLDTKDEAVVRSLGRIQLGNRQGYLMPRVTGDALSLKPGPGLTNLARAIHRLHQVDWPHGDLKPQNVRVNADGGVTLIDPLPVGSELLTPEFSHMNFLVASPLVDSADPRDRRMVARHRDLVALALMVSEAFAEMRPWGHNEVARMLDRSVSMHTKRMDLANARDRLQTLLGKLPKPLKAFVSLALEPGIWPEEGPIFAAYLQARPFETRCDALSTLDVGALVAEATAG
ncbi:MAG: hypothetical protein JNK72_04225 [Myxococcales bacterium]|nr:hypothetical protein [Myxococcales bacterium]